MHQVLARLADRPPDDDEESVMKLFEWTFNHSMEWAKIVIAFGASLVTSFLLAYFKDTDLKVHLELAPWAFGGAVLTVLAGIIYYWRIRRTRSDYVAGLRLYALLKIAVPHLKANMQAAYKLVTGYDAP